MFVSRRNKQGVLEDVRRPQLIKDYNSNTGGVQEADTIYMDGTFTCCPQLWNTLYSLHARKDDQTYPLVYALLPDRQTTTYVRLFENLKTHVHRLFNRVLDPVCVQTDFEMAAIRAVEQSVPNADIKGYMFHYTQAIWRKTTDRPR